MATPFRVKPPPGRALLPARRLRTTPADAVPDMSLNCTKYESREGAAMGTARKEDDGPGQGPGVRFPICGHSSARRRRRRRLPSGGAGPFSPACGARAPAEEQAPRVHGTAGMGEEPPLAELGPVMVLGHPLGTSTPSVTHVTPQGRTPADEMLQTTCLPGRGCRLPHTADLVTAAPARRGCHVSAATSP